MSERAGKESSGLVLYRWVDDEPANGEAAKLQDDTSNAKAPASGAAAKLQDDTSSAKALEVLLVHPSGNYNRRAPWGIPKGAPETDETMDAAARREVMEETGLVIECALTDLGHVDYTRSKKRVHAFAGPAPDGAAPRCASWEVDKVEFIEISRARRIIHPDQAPLLDRLLRHLGATSATSQGDDCQDPAAG